VYSPRYAAGVVSAEFATGGLISKPRSAVQTRILFAALDLFAEHGVSGTSLQMIADAIGVTKAAVYRQFKTKDEIVIAVTEMQLARLEDALDAAEGEKNRARELLLHRVVDMAVEQRRMLSILQFDPVIVRFLVEHKPFRQFSDRLFRALLGDNTSTDSLVQAAILSGAIGGAVMHPLLADLDDDTLRAHLLPVARRVIDLPD
jgi:AcrR family transcriptional regulator